METRAPFVVVGGFILAAIIAVFGFVYWLNNTGGLGARTTYNVQFNGPVPGLLVGAAVLFNGIRVGEVSQLSLAPDSPRRVNAVISVTPDTPVRRDTKVGLDFQGLTGVPVVALEGGEELIANGPIPILVAEPGAGQSMTQAARDALRRVDSILATNSDSLKATIDNLRIFSEGLAKNTGRMDGIFAGLEKMTGGGAPSAKVIYDLKVPKDFGESRKPLKGQLAISEPTTILLYDTQRILFMPPGNDPSGFANIQWSDSLPKLTQEKFIQSFENYDLAHAPLRASDASKADFQLQLDIRAFQITLAAEPFAEIGMSAKLVDKSGRILAARIFREKKTISAMDPANATSAFNDAFEIICRDVVGWTAGHIGVKTQ
ncbi:MAG: MCE family protein [Afipia sp.]|nr:MCE family protein [Afipia sp.]